MVSAGAWRAAAIGLALWARAAAAEPAGAWVAIPPADASGGERLSLGVGRARLDGGGEASVLGSARLRLRLDAGLHVELGVSGEAGGRVALGAPTLAIGWSSPGPGLRVALRAIAAVAVTREGDETLEVGVAGALLAQDPAITWGAADAGTLQAALVGDAGGLRWGVAAGLVEIAPVVERERQLLVRVDAGAATGFGEAWNGSAEVGVISDAVDEGLDEGTDLVPVGRASLERRIGELAVGASLTGGWIAGPRHRLLGPTLALELRGRL